MKTILFITFIITFPNDIIAVHNETTGVVEITMDDFIPEKCRIADYRGMIVEEIVSRNKEQQVYLMSLNFFANPPTFVNFNRRIFFSFQDLKKTFVFPNGYEKQIYCSPFNSTIYKELLDKVTNTAKKLQSNLICDAKLVLHNDGKVFNMGNFEQMLPCFAMMNAPAYFY